MAEEVVLAPKVTDRGHAGPADRVPGLAAPERAAAGVGHDHPDAGAGGIEEPPGEVGRRAHRVARKQYDLAALDVGLVDAGADPDVATRQDREHEWMLEQERLGLVEHGLDEAWVLACPCRDR